MKPMFLSPYELIRRMAMDFKSRPEGLGVLLDPQGEVEKQLCDMFMIVLKVKPVGAGDGFFALGGTSLQMAQVLARIAEKWNIELTYGDMFENPSPIALGRIVGAKLDAAAVGREGR